jgi:hypothetical protein
MAFTDLACSAASRTAKAERPLVAGVLLLLIAAEAGHRFVIPAKAGIQTAYAGGGIV